MKQDKFYSYLNILNSIEYKKQDHWDLYKEKFFKILSNFKSMDSFRSNGISNMLETGLPSQDLDKVLEGLNYETTYNDIEKDDILKRFYELKIMFGDKLDQIPFNNLIGNPRKHIHKENGKLFHLNFDDLYHVYSAAQISRAYNFLEEKTKISKILEIGGGYGNLASKLKKIFPKVKYIIVDLPEVLLIQNYYLSSTFKNSKIINLIDQSNFSKNIIVEEDFDFLLIPFNIYKKLNFEFDLVINTRSFGEMPKEVLGDYFSLIQNNIKEGALFYTTNRYVFTKSTDKNKLRDYPFDENWKMIISQPQWLQSHLHEFLLMRSTKKQDVPIKFILQTFPLQTPPPGPIMPKIQSQDDWLKNQSVLN